MGIIVYWGLYWGPPMLGNYHMGRSHNCRYQFGGSNGKDYSIISGSILGSAYLGEARYKAYMRHESLRLPVSGQLDYATR